MKLVEVTLGEVGSIEDQTTRDAILDPGVACFIMTLLKSNAQSG
jgi:hypothetical protein